MKEPNRRDLAAEEARNRILVAAADCIVRDGLVQRADGRHRQGGRTSPRAWCTTTSPPRSSSSSRCWRTPARSRNALTEQALERAGTQPAPRLSAFLDRCLPSDELLTHDWRLWQELDLLCLRQPELAKVGRRGLRDHLPSRRRDHHGRHRGRASSTSPRTRPGRSPRARSPCATASALAWSPPDPTSPWTRPARWSHSPSGGWSATTARSPAWLLLSQEATA